MNKKIKNISFFLVLALFSFFVTKYYFSEDNIIFTNKSRSFYFSSSKNTNLPLLKNDTSNIIFYVDDLQIFKNKRKKRFWEKLINNDKK